ncbi:MAG: Hsp33 family molecular chaperone HslO [Erysipelotrichaceae bacterium]|nr:Hsp33 family molecular chaperone HslO [Erysipelotrichaceae bacterium]
MRKNSQCLIALDEAHNIRIYLADTTAMVEEARRVHGLYPTSLAALGRLLSMTGVMGLMMKGERESVNVTVNGGGPAGTLMAVAKNNGCVKGLIGDPQLYEIDPLTGKHAVGKIVGTDGTLTVTKDLEMKERFSSQTALRSGEIGEDFAYYFMLSEQRPTVVSLGVLTGTDAKTQAAGVFFMELLPGHSEEDIAYLEKIAADMKPVSSLIDSGRDLAEILKSYFPEAEILETRYLWYQCDCSRERFAEGLLTLPKKDLLELAEEGDTEVRCDFCEKVYTFTPEEIREMAEHAEDR